MNQDYLIKKKPMYALALFALPMIIGNLFQQTYTMVDSAIVGRYVSEQALAAVGASYSLTNVFICVAIGGGMGASVVVSRHFGAKAYDRMKTAVYTALLTFLVISILLGSVGLLCGKWIMNLLQTPSDVLDLSVVYLNIYFLGLPFLFMYNVLSAMFNALGKSRIPLYFLVFSSIFNVGLDIFMVKSLHMGVSGVAWATLIAQGISAVLSFCVLLRTLRGIKGDQDAALKTGTGSGWKHIFSMYCTSVDPAAVYRVHRYDAGAIRGQQLWFSDAGRLFGCYACGIHMCCSHVCHGKCHFFLYGTEYRSRTERTGQRGISCGDHYGPWLCSSDLSGPGTVRRQPCLSVPGSRWHASSYADSCELHDVHGLVLLSDRF